MCVWRSATPGVLEGHVPRRKEDTVRTPLIAATAAALSALAVTVAGSAFGGGSHRSAADDGATADLRACLTTHGATVPAGDARALKQWMGGDHTPADKDAIKACGLVLPQLVAPGDATLRGCLAKHGATVPADDAALKGWLIGPHTAAEKDAIKACGVVPQEGVKVPGGPDEATLRACLADHGVTVPSGDGAVLKRWIMGTHTPAETDALTACGAAAAIKKGAPCADARSGQARAYRPARDEVAAL
jgi:hypothetical protein